MLGSGRQSVKLFGSHERAAKITQFSDWSIPAVEHRHVFTLEISVNNLVAMQKTKIVGNVKT